tara:strand:+ start:330 stop:1325 length:996 start_codon:yes stop_codon:yes gene_type:complete
VYKKQLIIINILIIVLIIVFIISTAYGSFNISIINFIKGNLNQLHNDVLLKIRFPRVILAGFVGAALSLSGACLQGLFRNPLADPGLIGVSSGAALGVALTIVIGNSFIPIMFNPYILPIAAIIGSAIVIIILFYITKGFGYGGMMYMLLAGIAINAFAGVGIGFLTYISDDSELRSLTFWTMGSFGGNTWRLIIPAILIIFITTIWILKISRKLDLIQLGEAEAQRLGVNITKLRFDIILSSAIIVGVSVSLVGIIGFIGLVIPHLIRILGGVNHNFLLKGSILAGALIMILSDLISRTIIKPAELPVGLITSAIGSPFFLWLIFRIRKN